MEYGGVLLAFCNKKLLYKFQAVENRAIRIAWRLAPSTLVKRLEPFRNFEPILERLNKQATQFLVKNANDPFVAKMIAFVVKSAKTILGYVNLLDHTSQCRCI